MYANLNEVFVCYYNENHGQRKRYNKQHTANVSITSFIIISALQVIVYYSNWNEAA